MRVLVLQLLSSHFLSFVHVVRKRFWRRWLLVAVLLLLRSRWVSEIIAGVRQPYINEPVGIEVLSFDLSLCAATRIGFQSWSLETTRNGMHV